MGKPHSYLNAIPTINQLTSGTMALLFGLTILASLTPIFFDNSVSAVGTSNNNYTWYDSDTTSLPGGYGGVGTNEDSYINDGAWKNNQAASKFFYYLPSSDLGEFTVSDIESISYATKKLNNVQADYFMTVYTKADGNDDDSWYGRAITIDPLYSDNFSANSTEWNIWNTSSYTPAIYDSNHAPYGWSGTFPSLTDLQNSTVNWSNYNVAGENKEIDYRNEVILGIAISTGSSWNSNFSGLIDDVDIQLKNGNSLNVDLEGADLNNSNFRNSPKYSQANNFGNNSIVAEIATPAEATDVRFTITGISNNSITDSTYSRDNKDDDIVNNSSQPSYKWWRLYKALPAGEHTITAEFQVDGQWFPVNGIGTSYAIDAPGAEYIIPNSSRNTFRSTDNPIRLKVEDQFEQFRRMVIKVNNNNYEVLRENCDLRQAGNYLLCDVDSSLDWTSNLNEGTYTASTTIYTKANNRLDNLPSIEFTIDNTKPSVSSLTSAPITKNPFSVSVVAIDDGDIKSVLFYITEPRNDGVCTGNGVKLSEQTVSTMINGQYKAILDVSGLNGDYCISAVARDTASNNSSIVTNNVLIDTTSPVIKTPVLFDTGENAEESIIKGAKTFRIEQTESDPGEIYVEYMEKDLSGTWRKKIGKGFKNTNTAEFTVDTKLYQDGAHQIKISTKDKAGNKDGYSFIVYVDHTAPDGTFIVPANAVRGEVNIQIDLAEVGFAELGAQQVTLSKSSGQIIGNWIYTVSNGKIRTISGGGTVTYSGDSKNGMLTINYDTTQVPAGQYNLRLFTKDTLGNGRSNIYGSIVVDNAKPSASITNPLNGDLLTKAFNVNGVASDMESGVTRVEYSVNEISSLGGTHIKNINRGIANGTSDWNFNVPKLDDGFYRLKVQVFDEAGNWKHKYIDVSVDSTAPGVSIDSAEITDDLLDLTLTGTDNLSGVDVIGVNIYNEQNTGDPVIAIGRLAENLPAGTLSHTVSSENIDLSSLSDGTYTIRAAARDYSGILTFATQKINIQTSPTPMPGFESKPIEEDTSNIGGGEDEDDRDVQGVTTNNPPTTRQVAQNTTTNTGTRSAPQENTIATQATNSLSEDTLESTEEDNEVLATTSTNESSDTNASQRGNQQSTEVVANLGNTKFFVQTWYIWLIALLGTLGGAFWYVAGRNET